MTTTAQPTDEANRFMNTAELMKLLRYSSRRQFTEFLRRSGVPMIRVSATKIIYERAAVDAWLQSRTIGRVKLPAHNQPIGSN
jgi:hypothetical protein